MAWDGSGNFSRVHNWQADEAASIDILSSRMDAEDDNLASGIDACLTQNNESRSTADFRPNVTRSYDLGTSSLRWRSLYAGTSINFQSATAGYATTIAVTDATAARTVTLPDQTGTIAYRDSDNSFSAYQTFSHSTTNSHIRSVITGNAGGSYITDGSGHFNISVGSEYDGTDWIARETSAKILSLSAAGSIVFKYNTPLTVGNSFTPTIVFVVDNAGVIQTGVVPVDRFRRTEASATNGSGATLTTSYVNISTVDLGTVTAGDRIQIFANAAVTKDTTAGRVTLRVAYNAGTGTVTFNGTLASQTEQRFQHAANDQSTFNISGMGLVTGSGTLTLGFDGVCSAGQATVSAFNHIYCMVLRNS